MPTQTLYIYFASFETNIGPRRCTVQATNKIMSTPQVTWLENMICNMFAKEGIKWASTTSLSLLGEKVVEVTEDTPQNNRFKIN